MDHFATALLICCFFSQLELKLCEPPGFAEYKKVDFQDGISDGTFVGVHSSYNTAFESPDPNICNATGLFPDPEDSNSFYECIFTLSNGYTQKKYSCEEDWTFSTKLLTCIKD